MTTTPPLRNPATPAARAMPAPPTLSGCTPKRVFGTSKGACRQAWKLGIYAEHGTGKSTLASLCDGAVFADIENSMIDLEVERVVGIANWNDLREWVRCQDVAGTVRGIDTMTTAQDWCIQHVLNTKSQDGQKAQTSLEDWKYKAGARFVYDEFKALLADIEASFNKGVCWIMIAHDFVEWCAGTDTASYKRHAPDLLETKEYSLRLSWARFCDHLAFIDRDISVAKGKATGGQSRTIYMDGAAHRMCKQRHLSQDNIPWPEGDKTLWEVLGVK